MKYVINIDGSGAEEAIRGVLAYRRWLEERTKELVQKLAERGAEIARVGFETAEYDGTNDVSVNVEDRGEFARAVIATGQATLFIEFGSGLIGGGHKEPLEYGPGTWSDGPQGKGHWQDPNGWYYAHDKKSFGNPPASAMYHARKQIEEDLTTIAREVFSH